MTLSDRLPPGPDPDALVEVFADWAFEEQGHHALPGPGGGAASSSSPARTSILVTPTGSGKSLVAIGAHFAALAAGRRTFYTAPIKALVSREVLRPRATIFGAENVGMLTGDAAVNADAPIICCTAEILANIALREGADADVGQVVMDEFHFYADPDRGWAWQVPLLELPQAQFLLMSATLGDVSALRGRPDPAHRPADGGRQLRASGPCRCTSTTSLTPAARDARGAARHRAGPGLRRALHPGRGARAGPGADERQRVHPRGEGRDRRR